MQTDEEVGKVAQAVPVIIYILSVIFNSQLILNYNEILFSLIKHT